MNRAERALQIWQVLIGAAHNRQTLTYEMLGKMIGLPHFGLANPLEEVQSHCRQNGLPPLTVLVVSKETGRPSEGYTQVSEESVDREHVFSFAWYSERPRQVSDFEQRSKHQTTEEG